MQDPMFVPPLQRVDIDLPCWPNQSKLVVFCTRDLSVWLGGRMVYGGPLIIILMFIFERPLNDALAWLGYDDKFVSHFFFLKEQYSYWVDVKKYDAIDTKIFHLLETAIWFSLAVWGTRLVTGIIFLRQYDKLYLKISKTWPARAKMYGALLFGVWGLLVVVELQWLVNGGAILLALKQTPNLFFFVISVLYFGSIGWIAKSILFIVWQVFRENWPWAVLWRDDSQIDRGEP